MNSRAFHQRLASTLPIYIGARQAVLCAVSGGVDSVVMLHALHAIRRRCGLALLVAHVDHGLRSDSADVAKWVGDLAQRMDLPFLNRRVHVPTLVRRGGVSVEEAARKARYAALEEMAIEAAATFVAVAHHADDQAETVLHHIIRGTALAGLAGMPAVRPIRDGSSILLIRPMLGFTRDEIEAYANVEGLDYCEDSTNCDTGLTRNRIRRRLLPMLRDEFNPRVVEALVRLANHARDGAGLMSDAARQAISLATLDTSGGVARLEVEALNRFSAGVRREVVRELLKKLGAPMQSLDQERLAAVHGVIEGNGRRRTIELPGGFAAQRRGKLLLVGPGAMIRSGSSASQRPANKKKTKRARQVLRG